VSKSTELKEFVNQLSTHFDELKLIIRDDFANREFKKSVFERFSIILFFSNQVRYVSLTDIGEDGASAEETADQVKGESGVSNNLISIPIHLVVVQLLLLEFRK